MSKGRKGTATPAEKLRLQERARQRRLNRATRRVEYFARRRAAGKLTSRHKRLAARAAARTAARVALEATRAVLEGQPA